MCLPLAAVGLIAGGLSAAVGAYGALYAGSAAQKQAEYQAQLSERNAGLEREAGQKEIDNARDRALLQYRKIAQIKGQQRAVAGGNGVMVDFGTASDLVDDTQMLGMEDVGRIYKQGEEARRGHDINAWNYLQQAAGTRAQGAAAKTGSMFSAAGSILGGVTQFAKLSGNFGSAAKVGNWYDPIPGGYT